MPKNDSASATSDQDANDDIPISLHSADLDTLLSHTIGNTMNELIFGLTYDKSNKVWNRIQYLREEGIKVSSSLSFHFFNLQLFEYTENR